MPGFLRGGVGRYREKSEDQLAYVGSVLGRGSEVFETGLETSEVNGAG